MAFRPLSRRSAGRLAPQPNQPRLAGMPAAVPVPEWPFRRPSGEPWLHRHRPSLRLRHRPSETFPNGYGRPVSEAALKKEVLQVVLVSPQIPGNTGCIARTCAASAVKLHLVEPLGFQVDDAKLKRAGLDYWPYPLLDHFVA